MADELLEQTLVDPETAAYAAIEVAKSEEAGSHGERFMLELAQIYAILALVGAIADTGDRLILTVGELK